MPILETERLLLRPYTPQDREGLHQILSDATTMQFWPAPYTLDGTTDWINNSISSFASYGHGRMAVILKSSQALIGDCGIVRAEINDRVENDLGYIIHHPYWHYGYALEAATACVKHALSDLHLTRLVANMATDHTASRRVAEKLGMKLELIFINQRNRNLPTCLYSLEHKLTS